MIEIELPESVMRFRRAHDQMCADLARHDMPFMMGGTLLGDIAEAVVAERFGLIKSKNRVPGADRETKDGKTVQIKATQKNNAGPRYTRGEWADYLIFVQIDFDSGFAYVRYNGPEDLVRALVPREKLDRYGTYTANLKKVLAADDSLSDDQRLPLSEVRD